MACPKFAVGENPTNQGVLQRGGEEVAKTESFVYLLIILAGMVFGGSKKHKKLSRLQTFQS